MSAVDGTDLGVRIRRRREELRYSREQVRDRTLVVEPRGVSATTIRAIENGTRTSVQDRTMRALMYALHWTAGSADLLARGEEPMEAGDDPEPDEPDMQFIGAQLKPDRQFSDSERAYIEAQMIAAARRAILDLERGESR